MKTYKALKLTQGEKSFYMFTARAGEIWSFSSINQKSDDKEDGYQRALSPSRASDIQKYVQHGNTIAPAIVLSFDGAKARFNEANSEIEIDEREDSAWVIDGQHRLKGAALADNNIHVELPVVAYIGLDLGDQIAQFITINREAKGVPTSLYYDLLKNLPVKSKPQDVAKEKCADIANQLRKDVNSVFYDKIVVVTSPRKGQISLNNFVRKVYPLILEGKGSFFAYSQMEFLGILDNYFSALKIVFPNEFTLEKQRFFQTLGFGAAINALYSVFTITLKDKNGFRVDDVVSMLQKMSDFKFSDWDRMGTGTSAENQAGRDFETSFKQSMQDNTTKSMLRLN